MVTYKMINASWTFSALDYSFMGKIFNRILTEYAKIPRLLNIIANASPYSIFFLPIVWYINSKNLFYLSQKLDGLVASEIHYVRIKVKIFIESLAQEERMRRYRAAYIDLIAHTGISSSYSSQVPGLLHLYNLLLWLIKYF